MSNLWTDGDFATPSAVGAPVFSAPLKGVKTQYVLKQEFMAAIATYTPPDLNTAHTSYPDYFFAEETEVQDTGAGGIGKFTRTYAKVPDQYITFATYGYNFIGFLPDLSTGAFGAFTLNGRERFNDNVRAKFVTDYYLIGTGGAYADAGLIPQIEMTIYREGDSFGSLANQYAFTDKLKRAAAYAIPTIPSREDYELLVTADKVITSFSIIAENSRLDRWMGNIWSRETRYVKAL